MYYRAYDDRGALSFDNLHTPAIGRSFSAEAEKPKPGKTHYRTAIISDLHLGRNVAFVEYLLEFFQNITFDKLILNGDIFDGLAWMANNYKDLPEKHKRCVDAMFAFAARGGELVYVVGNHDERVTINRDIVLTSVNGKITCRVKVCQEYVHIGANGEKILATHGHQEDVWHNSIFWKAIADRADRIYEPLLQLNQVFRKAAINWLGIDLSPIAPLKFTIKKFLGIDRKVREFAERERKRFDADMVVCAHTHGAEFNPKKKYGNDGNWVENGNFMAETMDGKWELVHWHEKRKELKLIHLPKESDDNPNAEYREFTDQAGRWFFWLYPKQEKIEQNSQPPEGPRYTPEIQESIPEYAFA